MPGQVQKTKATTTTAKDVAAKSVTSADKAKNDKLKQDLDDLLDEIDEVLETNAEQFVAQYVQKGGE